MAPTRLTLLFSLLLILVFVLITTAHFHPSTAFSLPLLPSAWPAVVPVVHEPPHVPDADAAEDRLLSAAQCAERFPDLYDEADRARAYWEERGGVGLDEVDEAERADSSARLTILGGKLYVKAFMGGINSRTQAAIAAVYSTVITSPEPMPDVDFVIQTSDAGGGEHPHFVLDRRAEQKHLWLMPDFGFFSWPEPGVGAYSEVRAQALAVEQSLGLVVNDSTTYAANWDNKEKKLMWRGAPMVEVRQELLRASENQPWSDVRSLDWGHVNDDESDRLAHDGDIKTPAEHCRYAFLAHVEGWAYSGRLKYLQQCRSVIVAPPMEYIQHFHHLFNGVDGDANQNMVLVPRPLEKHLPGVMEELLRPESEAKIQRILDNQWTMLRQGYISPAANECYYRHALRQYAAVQRFRPVLDRGIAYESFLLTGQTEYHPHR